LILGLMYALAKYTFDAKDVYIGTEEKPGINTAKSY
jgi:hypothetical protein